MANDALGITIDYDALAELQQRVGATPKIMVSGIRSALSSASYFLRTRLIEAARTNEFGWAPLAMHPAGFTISDMLKANPPEKGKKIKYPSGKSQQGRTFWGSSTKLITYKVNFQKLGTGIGVLGFNTKRGNFAHGLQTEHQIEKGTANPASARAYFGALGLKLKANKKPVSPQRELFAQVMGKYSGQVSNMLTSVIATRVATALSQSGKLFEGSEDAFNELIDTNIIG